jgi:hypothetical protein
MGSSKSDDYSKETPVVRHNTANKVTTLIPIAPNTPVTKKEITETPLSDRDILHKLGYTDQQIELMSEPLIQKITKEHRLSQIKTIKDIRELIAIFNSEAAPLDQELRQLSLEQISYNNTSDAMSTLQKSRATRNAWMLFARSRKKPVQK